MSVPGPGEARRQEFLDLLQSPTHDEAEAAPAPTRELNGAFLPSYEDRRAEAELDRLHQQDRQRARHEAVVLQASAAGIRPRPELILDESCLLPFHFLRTGDRLGRAVVKIERDDGSAGTGFLVAPGILLTNHHVLPDFVTAANAKALANYEAAPFADSSGQPTIVHLDPAEMFLTNPDLD